MISSMQKCNDSEFNDQETAKRRDEALKRALGMPHKPHKEGVDKKPTPPRSKPSDK